MRLDSSNATVTVASPASESLWGVGLLQSRERSSSLGFQGRIGDREEGRSRQQGREKDRKREVFKIFSRDLRTQQSPPVAAALTSAPSPPAFSLAPPPTFTVGYALTSKKTKSFIQPKLEEHARYSMQHSRVRGASSYY